MADMNLNNMGFGHMFPYANIHELNIDWLMAKLRELENRVEDLERRMTEAEARIEDHEQRIVWLETEFAKLREEWEAFKQYVEDRFDQLEAEIRELFAELEARIDAKFEQLKHQIEDRFTELESELKTQIQEILQYIIDTCAEFTEKVTRLTVRVENLEENMENCCLTITGKLDEIIDVLDDINPELREIVITRNGTYLAEDEGAAGYYKVVVDVQGGGVAPVLETLNVTANGTYTPSAGVDGFSEVTVNVPTGSVTPTLKRLDVSAILTPANNFFEADYQAELEHVDGFDPVTVDVDVETMSKEITENGTYSAEDDGAFYELVSVNVPQRTAEPITITENGVTNTPEGKFYDPINVDVPQITTQELDDSVRADTLRKTYTKTAPSGHAYSSVNIEVLPTPSEEKIAVVNGRYTPSSGKLLAAVDVRVPQRTAEPITITENGVTNTPEGKFYDPITVDVQAANNLTAQTELLMVQRFYSNASDQPKYINIDRTYYAPTGTKKAYIIIEGECAVARYKDVTAAGNTARLILSGLQVNGVNKTVQSKIGITLSGGSPNGAYLENTILYQGMVETSGNVTVKGLVVCDFVSTASKIDFVYDGTVRITVVFASE